MSWLTDIAGKAESFLNKLDSEAASVLTDSKNKAESHSDTVLSEQSTRSFGKQYLVQHGGSSTPQTPQHLSSRNSGAGLPNSASVPGDLHDYFRSTSVSSSTTSFGSPSRKSTRTSHNETPTATSISSSASFSSLFGKNKHSSGQLRSEDFLDTGVTMTRSLFKDTTSSHTTPQHSRNPSQDHCIDFTQQSSHATNSDSPMTWLSDGSRMPAVQEPHQSSSKLDTGSRHSRQSSLSSGASSAIQETGSAAYTSLILESSSTASSVASSACSGQLDSFVKVDHPDLSSSAAIAGSEVELLKREVVSLNQEIRHLVSRERATSSEVQSLRAAQNTGSDKLSAAQRRLGDLQQREMDLQENVRARDSQLAVLHRRLQQMEKDMGAKEATLSQCQQENARLCEGASVSSGRHSEALVGAQGRLKEAEAALERLRLQHRHEEEGYASRIRAVESEKEALREQLAEVSSKLQAEKSRQTGLQAQLASVRQEAADARQELESYKAKARHILASKEALIEALKGGRASTDAGEDQEELLTSELQQARAELSLSREELSRGVEELKRVRAELAEQERRAEHEAELSSAQLAEVEQRLADQRAAREQLEDEARRAREETRLLQEEVSRQKVLQAGSVQEAQAEITTLRRQLAQRINAGAGGSAVELQHKVSALTETLLHKQSSIDTLSTELQASNLQIARLQHQSQDRQSLQYRDGGHSDDLRARVPTLLIESPFDGGVTRRVKRAYSTLDRLSVGLGVFLRRYPVARIMVLLYMLLLHVWVLLVLLTYTPEIHPAGYHPHPSGGGGGVPEPPLPPAPDT